MFDFAEFRKLVEREQGEVARVANSTLMLKYIERVSDDELAIGVSVTRNGKHLCEILVAESNPGLAAICCADRTHFLHTGHPEDDSYEEMLARLLSHAINMVKLDCVGSTLITGINSLNDFLSQYGIESCQFIVSNDMPEDLKLATKLPGIELLDVDALIVKSCLAKNKTSRDYGATSVISRRIRAFQLNDYVECDEAAQPLAEQLGLYIRALEEAQYRELYLWVTPHNVALPPTRIVKLTHHSPPEVVELSGKNELNQGASVETHVI